jgi:serine/threonine protein kinase/Tol biopolymer transport system component
MTRVSLQQWQQAKEIFTEALTLSGSEQKEFLDRACGNDQTLRNEVESLLNSYQHAASFMEVPAVESAAESLLNETSQLKPGQQIKHYEIVEKIGEGGMGEVYLARDTILGRRVALKFLPGYLRSDPDRLRRFQQEARAASTLSHPNVCVIHEVGDTEDGHPFITMEYIEGTTLRERMNSEPMSITEALEIAVQVAEALSAAHEAGIVHRDIKPENIMIRKDGYVKVLDFGLAKLTEHRKPATGMTMSTLLLKSSPGAVMGTAAYMSPEQARGVDVDSRTDVWSLGVVLYEMIAGEPPFVGQTPTDVVVAIVDKEPIPVSEYLEEVPEELERIIRKSLRKDQAMRYQLVREMAIDLRTLQKDVAIDRSAAPRSREVSQRQVGSRKTGAAFAATNRISRMAVEKSRSLRFTAFAVLAVVVLSVTLFGLYKWRQAKAPSVSNHFQEINVTKLTTNGSAIFAAISPEGRYVAYIKSEGGKESLWLRQIGTTANVEIVLAKDGHYSGLMFSPDGNFIYYGYAGPKDDFWEVYKVPTLGVGATAVRVNPEEGPSSISGDGKRMAFVRFDRAKRADFLKIANVDGSNEQIVATRSWPERLSYDISSTPAWTNNDQTLTLAMVNNDNAGFYFSLYEIQLDTRVEKTIALAPLRFEQPSRITLLSDGSGIVTSGKAQGASFAQVWLLGRDGTARSITNDLSDYRDAGLTNNAKSLVTVQNQTLANLFVAPNTDLRNQKQITFGLGRYFDLSWAPDNKILYASDASGSADIFETGADGTNLRQLTSGVKRNYAPSVSPDNRYIVFHSNRSGTFQVWRMDRDGNNPLQLTNQSPESNWPVFSADSKWVFFQHFEPGKEVTLWKTSVDGGTPVKISSGGPSLRPRVSPDGKWLAFWQTDAQPASKWRLALFSLESGTIVKAFDLLPSVHVQWDTNLGWTPDSRGLVYVDTHAGVENLWVQSLDGSPAKQLTNFNESHVFSFDWSRSGTLVTSRGVITGDVVLISDAGK